MISPSLVPVVTALLVALGAGGILVAAFYPRLVGDSASKRRLAMIAGVRVETDRQAGTSEESRRRRSVEATLRELEEKQKAQKKAKPSLVGRMRQAGLSWSRRRYYIVCLLIGLAVLAAVLSFRLGMFPALIFGVSGGALLPHLYVNFRRNRRFRSFTEEFPNAVDVVVRGVKAGLPLVDCLKIIAAEAQEPVRGEFRHIAEDQAIGVPLDEAVQRMPERMPLPEANFFAIVITIQSRTGGNLSEALGNLSKVLRERKKMRGKIKAMSSEAKASGGIIGSLPVVVGGLVYLTSPDYIMLLFTHSIGNLVLAASAVWMGLGVLVMRKMINFDF